MLVQVPQDSAEFDVVRLVSAFGLLPAGAEFPAPAVARLARLARTVPGTYILDVSPERPASTAKLDLGPLQVVLDDPEVTEIMVNRYDEIWIERGGELFHTNLRFANEHAVRRLAEQVALFSGRNISEREPMLDARLPDGSRLNAVYPPLSLGGPVLTIRRFPERAMSPDDLVQRGSLSPPAVDFLHGCVVARRSILISGGTGSGKTTFLNALSTFIPNQDRIVTIEDTAELRLNQPHWIRLESRGGSFGNERDEVTIRDLLRNSLRMRPDRIVVGEVRGGEAFDMLQAMTTGHDGSLSTIHANSPRDALARLETLVLMSGVDVPQRAVRDQIASAVQVLVHLERGLDGVRRVAQISEIVGREGEVVTMQDIFKLDEHRAGDGSIRRVLVNLPVRPRSLDAMVAVREQLPAGLLNLYPDPALSMRDQVRAHRR